MWEFILFISIGLGFSLALNYILGGLRKRRYRKRVKFYDKQEEQRFMSQKFADSPQGVQWQNPPNGFPNGFRMDKNGNIKKKE